MKRDPLSPTIMQYRFKLIVAILGTTLMLGCASVWPPKPAAEDVARNQDQREEELVDAFERKRDQAQFEAAMVRWREGDLAGCRELVDKLLARRPEHRGGRLLRAEFRLVEEKPEIAIADIEALVKENPDDAEAVHLLGLLLEASGRDAEALVQFENAVKLAPNNPAFTASYQTALTGEASAVSQVAHQTTPQSAK